MLIYGEYKMLARIVCTISMLDAERFRISSYSLREEDSITPERYLLICIIEYIAH
jgi:hypothetical protein